MLNITINYCVGCAKMPLNLPFNTQGFTASNNVGISSIVCVLVLVQVSTFLKRFFLFWLVWIAFNVILWPANKWSISKGLARVRLIATQLQHTYKEKDTTSCKKIIQGLSEGTKVTLSSCWLLLLGSRWRNVEVFGGRGATPRKVCWLFCFFPFYS